MPGEVGQVQSQVEFELLTGYPADLKYGDVARKGFLGYSPTFTPTTAGEIVAVFKGQCLV